VHLHHSASDHAFRIRLRDWLAATVPSLPPAPGRDDWPARRGYDAHWQRLLHEAGYAGINWPREYGGRGATPTEHLAFCCDLVVAAEEATFIEIFARRGLAADGLGTWLLPRMIGLQRAKELILLAEDVPAARAYELGLVTRVVPAAELRGTVRDLARRLASGPTRAHSANKWLLNHSLDVDRHTLAQEESWIVDALSYTEDSAEGVSSFVERRAPHFRGA